MWILSREGRCFKIIIVGADIGKHKTKIKWKGGEFGHLSKISTGREIKDNIKLDSNDYIIVEYNNKKYLAGELAEREGQNFLNSPQIQKSNLVTVLNLLIGLSRLPSKDFNIVVGNPFVINYKNERESIKNLLIGTKEFIVNGKEHKVNIHNVGVAPEGVAAWYSYPVFADCNILDFGSTTINAIAIRNKRLVDRKSHTFEEGFETMIDHNYEGLMEYIKLQMEKKWDDGNNRIICIGGKAPDMFNYVRKFYPENNAVMHNNCEYANAIGLYELGVAAYAAS